MAQGALFFTCYDGFDVIGWFPRENMQECMHLHANGSNRAVSERLGQFSALLQKTTRGALFFTCYDLFDVIGWFPRENIKECVRLHANRSNRAVSERLGEFNARLHKIGRRALFFTCYDVFDVNGWFPNENTQDCVRFHANGSNRAVSVRLG